MTERSIAREQWPSFAESFSGQHNGWLVSVESDDADRDEELKPLHDFTIRGDRAIVRTGDATSLAEHELRGVRDVRVTASNADGSAIQRVALVGANGALTICFRSAIAPELVDGAL